MKRIVILGSTGSIGQSALEVIRHFPKLFQVLGLVANSNTALLSRQIEEFHPEFACLMDTKKARQMQVRRNLRTKLFIGEEGLEKIIADKRLDEIVMGISGSAALRPLLKAIECGCDIALANKEALVMAGPIIMKEAGAKNVLVIPVDSEQSAIWQCLEGRNANSLKNIYLTASGGPFRETSKKDLKNVSIAEVLKHPRWKMGKKISVDSATLMNKGLEVIEAMYLFNVDVDRIKILIHPEAIIHSMVEFVDGVIIAQLSATDMRIPIQYALTYPKRLQNSLPTVDFFSLKSFNFQRPDLGKFPCLGLAYRAAQEGGTAPCVLNAANEVSVEEFLKGQLGFISIPKVIEKTLASHKKINNPSLKDILEADRWAREEALLVIERIR